MTDLAPPEIPPSARPPDRPVSRWDLPPVRYIVLGVILLALVATGLASLASPWFAFTELRSAAVAQDRDALAELIDTDAVRGDLYPQLDARLPVDPPPEQPRAAPAAPEPRPRWLPSFVPWPLSPPSVEEVLRPITRPVERPVRIRRAIDATLTPESLARLSTGDARVRDFGLRRFRVAVEMGESETIWSFRRTGVFDWRLVGITLPAEGAG